MNIWFDKPLETSVTHKEKNNVQEGTNASTYKYAVLDYFVTKEKLAK